MRLQKAFAKGTSTSEKAPSESDSSIARATVLIPARTYASASAIGRYVFELFFHKQMHMCSLMFRSMSELLVFIYRNALELGHGSALRGQEHCEMATES